MNNGKVGFPFSARGVATEPQEGPEGEREPTPWGVPVLCPSSGFIPAKSRQCIQVKFLPGVPQYFERSFQIQVAHFEADTVRICGEGAFPRIALDLPRLPGDEEHQALVREVRAAVAAGAAIGSGRPSDPGHSPAYTGRHGNEEGLPAELEVQLEVERRVLAQYAEQLASGLEPPPTFRRTKGGKVK